MTDGDEGDAPTASGMLSAALGRAARRAGLDPAEGSGTAQVIWRAMGGVRGVLESVLPTLVFVVAWTVTADPRTGHGNLPWALGLSVGLAVLFTVARLVTRTPVSAAAGGLAVAVAAAALALLTGRAADNFLVGIITNAVYGAVLLMSLLVRRPLAGLVVNRLVDPRRAGPAVRRASWWLTLAWAALFLARLAAELPLFLTDRVVALGTVRLLTGLPPFALLVAVSWLVLRGLHRGDPAAPSPAAGAGDR